MVSLKSSLRPLSFKILAETCYACSDDGNRIGLTNFFHHRHFRFDGRACGRRRGAEGVGWDFVSEHIYENMSQIRVGRNSTV